MSIDIFNLIHYDVWGSFFVSSIVDLDILLYLLMIILPIARFLIWNIVQNYCKYILILQKWLKLNFLTVSKFFDLIMLLNTLNMLSKLFCIPITLFIN